MEDMIPQPVRAWLYRIGAALIPILVSYGLVAENTAALWLGLLGAILGSGEAVLAAIHTPTRPPMRDNGAGSR